MKEFIFYTIISFLATTSFIWLLTAYLEPRTELKSYDLGNWGKYDCIDSYGWYRKFEGRQCYLSKAGSKHQELIESGKKYDY